MRVVEEFDSGARSGLLVVEVFDTCPQSEPIPKQKIAMRQHFPPSLNVSLPSDPATPVVKEALPFLPAATVR